MDPLLLGLVALLLFLVAFVYSNLGMGGGHLFVPILLTFVTSLKEVAVPMSLAFTIATAISATYNHHRRGLVNGRLATFLVGGALIGAVIGALFTLASSRVVFLAFFSIVLVVVGMKMLRDWLRRVETFDRDDDSRMTRPRLTMASTTTLSSGFLAGSLGIGGGVANVPIMVYLLGRRTRLAIGTSTLMIIPISTIGIASYFVFGGPSPLDYGVLAVLWPLVLIGSFLGSRWGLEKLRARSVALIFILVLFVAAGKLLMDLALG
ncbi:MAG: sulfite exporter TauE/SafE family protein [Candidatus Thermoplasmatota archaeon]|nr:sulfite exporter TauE/SafE family protein [Candidatus Thermoplasmatota archaeon]